MLSLSNFCKLKFNCFTFSNSSENIAILCTLLSKAIRFLPVNFLFDNKTLIVLLESLFSSLSVNFNWNDCNWEFKISIYLKSGYLSFVLESSLKKELVIENVRAKSGLLLKFLFNFGECSPSDSLDSNLIFSNSDKFDEMVTIHLQWQRVFL